jgi:hypothetical protein
LEGGARRDAVHGGQGARREEQGRHRFIAGGLHSCPRVEAKPELTRSTVTSLVGALA